MLLSIVLLFLFSGISYLSGDKNAFSFLFSPSLTPTKHPEVLQSSISSQSAELGIVTKVVDGDTIQINGNLTVRYIGIDTPETVDPRREVGCFGKEASEKNKLLVLGKEVRLEKDVSETDRYGRLLRYVYVDNVMVNEQLVLDGYAQSSSYPPDIKYQERFDAAERLAIETKRGLWGSCQ